MQIKYTTSILLSQSPICLTGCRFCLGRLAQFTGWLQGQQVTFKDVFPFELHLRLYYRKPLNASRLSVK